MFEKGERVMDKLLSVKEAAPFLGIEPGTLQKWAQAGRITHYRIGGRPKFKAQDIERFLAALKVSARPTLKTSKRNYDEQRPGLQTAHS